MQLLEFEAVVTDAEVNPVQETVFVSQQPPPQRMQVAVCEPGHVGIGKFKPWSETTSLAGEFAPLLQNDTSMRPAAICPLPRAADTYGSSAFLEIKYSGGPMLQDEKGELKRGADELVVQYFEYTDANGVVRRAYASGSLDGDLVVANLLLSLRELRSVEYLSHLSPELRALVQKARRAPRPEPHI